MNMQKWRQRYSREPTSANRTMNPPKKTSVNPASNTQKSSIFRNPLSRLKGQSQKADNRRMTGNINIYICSEPKEKYQGEEQTEKYQEDESPLEQKRPRSNTNFQNKSKGQSFNKSSYKLQPKFGTRDQFDDEDSDNGLLGACDSWHGKKFTGSAESVSQVDSDGMRSEFSEDDRQINSRTIMHNSKIPVRANGRGDPGLENLSSTLEDFPENPNEPCTNLDESDLWLVKNLSTYTKDCPKFVERLLRKNHSVYETENNHKYRNKKDKKTASSTLYSVYSPEKKLHFDVGKDKLLYQNMVENLPMDKTSKVFRMKNFFPEKKWFSADPNQHQTLRKASFINKPFAEKPSFQRIPDNFQNLDKLREPSGKGLERKWSIMRQEPYPTYTSMYSNRVHSKDKIYGKMSELRTNIKPSTMQANHAESKLKLIHNYSQLNTKAFESNSILNLPQTERLRYFRRPPSPRQLKKLEKGLNVLYTNKTENVKNSQSVESHLSCQSLYFQNARSNEYIQYPEYPKSKPRKNGKKPTTHAARNEKNLVKVIPCQPIRSFTRNTNSIIKHTIECPKCELPKNECCCSRDKKPEVCLLCMKEKRPHKLKHIFENPVCKKCNNESNCLCYCSCGKKKTKAKVKKISKSLQDKANEQDFPKLKTKKAPAPKEISPTLMPIICKYCEPPQEPETKKATKKSIKKSKKGNQADKKSVVPVKITIDPADANVVTPKAKPVKPVGSEVLPYQKLRVYSDVMNELQQKMSEMENCKCCETNPCSCRNSNSIVSLLKPVKTGKWKFL